MDVAALLHAKKIVSSRTCIIGVSVVAQGSPARFYVRTFLGTNEYSFLSESFAKKAPTLRAEVNGNVALGLLINFTENAGRTIVAQSKSTSALSVVSRDLDATENRVPNAPIPAVLVEYEDGSRYLITAPLPDAYLSTKKREHRRDHPSVMRSAQLAFEAAGAPLPLPGPVPDPAAEPAPPRETPALVGHAEASAVRVAPIQTNDLREILEMLNSQIGVLRERGAEVVLRLEENRVRAHVSVVFSEDI